MARVLTAAIAGFGADQSNLHAAVQDPGASVVAEPLRPLDAIRG